MRSYGALELDRIARTWRVGDLAPHAAIAFKRLFPRIPLTATHFKLSDTDQIRADLQWFMQRYPLDVRPVDNEAICAGVARIADRLAERDRILLPNWQPGDPVGFREGEAPYHYQAGAAHIALAFGALLIGDDVGLGKTVSAIATLTSGAPLPAAVVVQADLARQWKKQIERFTNLRVHIIKSRAPYDLPPADVYIFSYSKLAGWVDIFDKHTFPTVAYDEIQELRTGSVTEKGRAAEVASSRAKLRLGLSATPVYNYGDEIHSIFQFLQPDLLGSRDEFVREWCGKGRIVKDPDALGSYLQDTGFFLRRQEDDEAVNASLPPPNVLEWEVDYDHAAASAEDALTKQLAQTVLKGSFVEAGRAARELDVKMRLITGVAKARSVAAYVKLLLEDSPRVLLGGWHREVYDIWLRELAAFDPVLYTGTETAAGKARSVAEFTAGKSRVMMMSLRSARGVDGLQHNCREAVVGELDWSPQVHHQFIGRVRRPGQTEQVNAHYLTSAHGSDPVLMEMLGLKADQSRGINDPGQSMKARFSDDSRLRRLAQHVLGELPS